MLSNWMSICLYQYLKVGPTRLCQGVGEGRGGAGTLSCPAPSGWLCFPTWLGQSHPWLSHLALLQDSAGEPLYKLFKAIKHQVEKGPVDAVQKKAKYTLNDTGLLGDDVEYTPLVSPQDQVPGQPQNQKLDATCFLHGLSLAPIPCAGPTPAQGGALRATTPGQLPPGFPGCCRHMWGPAHRMCGGKCVYGEAVRDVCSCDYLCVVSQLHVSSLSPLLSVLSHSAGRGEARVLLGLRTLRPFSSTRDVAISRRPKPASSLGRARARAPPQLLLCSVPLADGERDRPG